MEKENRGRAIYYILMKDYDDKQLFVIEPGMCITGVHFDFICIILVSLARQQCH